ncbi:hypothetical protein ACFU5O_32240 [Streptomyces sp. NPDC057445]|uniref:hypothetical protein n=1 Tax=Streptomyces sp. NPDC057445 TaxID=3346136 RepID=UPI0036CD6F8B
MDAVQRRYETYLGRTAQQDGPARVFDLDDAALMLVPASGLASLLPGEHPVTLPAFADCTVAVRDLSHTRDLLRGNGLPLREGPHGDVFVPTQAALGTTVAFRQAPSPTADR